MDPPISLHNYIISLLVECRVFPFDENVLEMFSWFVICRYPDNLSPADIDLHGEDHCLASYLGFYCFYQKKLGRDFGQHFSMCQLCPARLSSAGLRCDHGSALGPHKLKYCILSQEAHFTSRDIPPPFLLSLPGNLFYCRQNLNKNVKF